MQQFVRVHSDLAATKYCAASIVEDIVPVFYEYEISGGVTLE